MILLLHVKQNKTKLSKSSHPHNTIIESGYNMKDYLSDETSKIDVPIYMMIPELSLYFRP